MNADVMEWKHTKSALRDFEDILRCWKCNMVVCDPMSYGCGHFFCGQCVDTGETICPMCQFPSKSSEITRDRLVDGMVTSFRNLASIISPEWSELFGYSHFPRQMNEEETTKPTKKCVMPLKSSRKSDALKNDINKSTVTGSKGASVGKRTRGRPHGMQFEESLDLLHCQSQDKTTGISPPKIYRTRKSLRKDSGDDISNSSVSQKPAAPNKAGSANLKGINQRQSKTSKTLNRGKKLQVSKRKSFATMPKLSSTESLISLSSEEGCKTPKDKVSKDKTGLTSSNSNTVSSIVRKPKRVVDTSPKTSVQEKPGNFALRDKVTSQTLNVSKKSRGKVNSKGETPLHVACINGNTERVRLLLSSKANPNTKDHAGWTPLHEAAIKGHVDIAELLLNARAFVDTPGNQNFTPLHEAVAAKCLPIIRLLVAHGANIHALASDGKSPLDLADSEEVKEALLETQKAISSTDCADVESIVDTPPIKEDMVLCGAFGLSKQELNKLNALGTSMNVKVVSSFRSEVTHLVAPSDNLGTCPVSMDVLSAIMKGTWLLTRDWLEMNNGYPTGDLFEVSGVTDFQDAYAPKQSRINAHKQLPGLFNGCHFFLFNNVSYSIGACSLSKLQLSTLIKFGGGIVLSRQPNPEAIPASERTIPYHAARTSALASTSHYIIFSPGKGEPELKYNMNHVKSLTVEWLIHCILNWKLIDP